MTTTESAAPEGVILRVANGEATVRLDPVANACGGCAHAGGCGIGRLASMRGERSATLVLPAPVGCAPGARVALAEETSLPRLALLGYGLPVLCAFIGAACGQAAFGGDAPAALGAVLGFAAALASTRPLTRFLFRAHGGAPVSLSLLTNPESGHERTTRSHL